MSAVAERIKNQGITIPAVTPPVANYVPVVISGQSLIVSGQLPMKDGKAQFVGKLGQEFTVEQGQECARLCGVNILAQVSAALDGDWSKVKRLVRLGVFVNATDAFVDHPKVANGVSDMMVAVFGDAGKHARAAVGVSSLPFGVAVEVDAIFELV
jgi:enamine deaminase RidA (YjgF/YER057c/UK114 family)